MDVPDFLVIAWAFPGRFETRFDARRDRWHLGGFASWL